MPLVQAKCPNCGGSLSVDNGKDAWVCPFCDTPFVVEKAINNYNITNNISAGNVEVYVGKASMSELLEKENVYIKLGDLRKLKLLYEQMIDLYPARYEGWWGKIYLRVQEEGGFDHPSAEGYDALNKKRPAAPLLQNPPGYAIITSAPPPSVLMFF